jgi:hypothetical protein
VSFSQYLPASRQLQTAFVRKSESATSISPSLAHGNIVSQACDVDIIQALQDLGACGIPSADGASWGKLDFDLCFDILENLLLTCIEHDLPLKGFDPQRLIRALNESSDDVS